MALKRPKHLQPPGQASDEPDLFGDHAPSTPRERFSRGADHPATGSPAPPETAEVKPEDGSASPSPPERVLTREGIAYLLRRWISEDVHGRVWLSLLPERGEFHARAQLWQLREELTARFGQDPSQPHIVIEDEPLLEAAMEVAQRAKTALARDEEQRRPPESGEHREHHP